MTSDLLDERLRSAAESLHRDVSLRALPELPAPRSSTLRTVVMAFAAIAVLLIGLIVIGNRQDDLPPAGPDDDLHWLLDGWTPTGIFGPGSTMPQDFGNEVTRSVFGTPDGLEGPVVVVSTSMQDGPSSSPADTRGATNYVERTVDGVDVVLADLVDRIRLGFAKYDGKWVSIGSRGLSDDELFDIAGHLVIAPDGAAEIVPGHGPTLTRLAAGTWLSVMPVMWAGLDGQGHLPGVLRVSFESDTAGGPVDLIVSRSPDSQLAQWSMFGEAIGHTVDGVRVWERKTPVNNFHEVGWKSGDALLFLSGPLDVDLVALVPAVRRAAPAEWMALEEGMTFSEGPDVTALAGTVPMDEGAPAATDPPPEVSAATSDVSLVWTITNEHPNDVTMSVRLPDGTESSVSVAIVAGSYRISGGDGVDVGSMSGEWADDSPEVFQAQFPGFQLITRDPAVASVRVRLADGSRATLPLVHLTGHPGVGVAVLALEDQFVSADLLDADGNVLRTTQRT